MTKEKKQELAAPHKKVLEQAKKILQDQGDKFKFSSRLSPKENAAKFEAGTALKLREIEGEEWKHEIRFGIAEIEENKFSGTMHVCDEKKERMVTVKWSVAKDKQ